MADEFGVSSLDYPANNGKEKEIKSIKLKGGVKKEKQSLGEKFKGVFGCSSFSEVKSYIFTDIIVPSLKELIYNVVTGGLEVYFFQQRRARPIKGKNNYTVIDNPSYRTQSKLTQTEAAKNGYDFSTLTFDNRDDATNILISLKEAVDMYGIVTVADLYSSCGIDSTYVDQNWGWKNLSSAYISVTRKGYIINFPRVEVV